MKPSTALLVYCALLSGIATPPSLAAENPRDGRWPAEKAWEWYKKQPWIVGFNFVPSTACNTTEWWQGETFDPATIDRELGLAKGLAFNSTRVFIQYIVWKQDPAGFKKRFEQFLALANKHGITVMPVLFDDCGMTDPILGTQQEPTPGMILPSWTQSPGRKLGNDPAERPMLKRYVQDMLTTFGKDPRIIVWDLFNEPMNNFGHVGQPAFLEELFAWAHEVRPEQPLTVCIWHDPYPATRVALAQSDVVSFHLYSDFEGMRKRIAGLKKTHQRPILCTEWMARPLGSKWATDLPLFKEQGVGCYNWGLVNGRTQCQFSWYDKKGTPEPKIWFHDLFHKDGTPYDPAEHEAIRKTTADKTLDWSKCDYTKGVRSTFTDGAYRFSMGWTRWTGAGPNGNRLFYANEPEETVTATVTGKRVVLIHKAGPDCGIASVTLDGKPAGEFDTYSAAVDWNRRTTVAEGLSDGTHEVIITATGKKSPQSQNAYVQVVDIEPTSPAISESQYRGWKSQKLGNGCVELQILPEIGGRVIQFTFGNKEFLWVNAQLAGKLPPSGGLAADGGWFNLGGDKLWPAPQGWDNDQQWPGPPDAVLDGQPYRFEKVDAIGCAAAVRLTSGKDQRSGIQFSRTIRIEDDSSHVAFDATMKNIDNKPRRWGIWSHTQLDGATSQGKPNTNMVAYCPINPGSHFAKGYSVIFGAADNPSFLPDSERKMMQVRYQYQVGKIGLDSHAGWVSTVDGASETAFVQRFDFVPKQEYPDGSSVEFWHNGRGSFRAWGKENVMKDDPVENPCVFESEMISPFAELKPGETYAWHYDWYACRIGGEYPVLECSPVGVMCEKLTARRTGTKLAVGGRFGVFYAGHAEALFCDEHNRPCGAADLGAVSPRQPLVLSGEYAVPGAARKLTLAVRSTGGKELGQLATTAISP